jgi:hypothetical protein
LTLSAALLGWETKMHLSRRDVSSALAEPTEQEPCRTARLDWFNAARDVPRGVSVVNGVLGRRENST